jgi:hypothetical protein
VTALRSVVISAGQLALRDVGFEGRYFAAMEPAVQVTLRGMGVSDWIDVETAMLHYRTLDGMNLREDEIEAIAQVMSNRVNGVVLRTLGAAVRAAGGPSAEVFARYATRVWQGKFMGGTLDVTRRGPKDLRCTLRGLGLLGTSRYFRLGISQQFAVALSRFTHKCYVKPLMLGPTDEHTSDLSWV